MLIPLNYSRGYKSWPVKLLMSNYASGTIPLLEIGVKVWLQSIIVSRTISQREITTIKCSFIFVDVHSNILYTNKPVYTQTEMDI